MNFSRYWPNVQKRWAGNGIVIGWSPYKGGQETDSKTVADMIVLQHSPYKCVGRTGSQKLMTYERNRGDFSFVPKGVDQYVRTEESGELLYIALDPSIRKQFITELNPSLAFDAPLVNGRALARYDELSSLLMDFLLSDGFGGNLRGEALAALVMSTVMKQFDDKLITTTKHHLAPHKLKLVISFIDEHTDQNISVDMLANLVGVSKFHFTRMFKLETGLSPYQYVLRHRIKKAQNLLVNSKTDLAIIALDAGFSSQSHMSEAFSKVMGVTPGYYRRTIQS